jgi:carboxypeptidase C (cathepsin A)
MRPSSHLVAVSALALAIFGPALAQEPAPAPAEQGRAAQSQPAPGERARPDGPRAGRAGDRIDGQRPSGERGQETRKLPPDAVTQHVLELPDRILRFTATAGALQLTDPQGALQAEISYVAYVRDGAEPGARPVTFAVNGGPGAASAYLHLGVLGPWRLPLDGPSVSPSAAPTLMPNPETWLDFTDLVFIDPVSTGYSRAVGSAEDVRNRYFTIEGDIDTLSAVVARWLRMNDRMPSPKFFVGESYGGFRGPLLADKLQRDIGIGFSGIVLLSPVLDFGWFAQPRHAPWIHVTRLPSYAASCLERKGPLSREALREAEVYAAGEYLGDLFRGLQDAAAVERLGSRAASFICIDPAIVRRLAGRVDVATFQRELMRGSGRVVSAYDAGVTGYDPQPTAATSHFSDPLLTAMTAPLTSAMVDHLSRTLNWKVVDQRYQLLNGSVSGGWRWGRGRGPAETLSKLGEALARDGQLRILIVHGFTDLVTPYFASQLLIDQLPDYGQVKRVSLAVYAGGHMFYSRDPSRTAFRADAQRLYREALEGRQNGKAP